MTQKKSIMEIFDKSVAVFGAPGRYVQGPAALDLLGDCVATLGTQAVVVIDSAVRSLVESRIVASLEAANVDRRLLPIDGELLQDIGCSLAAACADFGNVEVVVGVGGGRAIDASKALAEVLNCSLVTVPTIASNDAPTSKNFVLYTPMHELAEVRHLMRNPDYVLVDETVISAAPKSFLAAGIGDAIAKKFEADACTMVAGANMFAASPTRTAAVIAEACYQTLLTHGIVALEQAGLGQSTRELSATIEATILMAGLGFESGGLSVAHAMTRGLSRIEGVKSTPHGFQVAYALLVQLKLQGIAPDPRMIALYRSAGLPLSLTSLAGEMPTDEQLLILAKTTLPVPHVRNFPCGVTESSLVAAVHAVEADIFPETGS
ncbi:iron-containing alcohol dehydrogenase [Celeribacter halophilus]|uniref:iron-containing alcohol dehydrogenase n=1 Tax=Celeribacter halophilus TaxID=576117 RepID=UPI003A904C0E